MDGDRLETLQRRVAELERELADLDGRPGASEQLRAAAAELRALADELRQRELTLEAARRAFESARALQPGEERFQNVFEHAPIGMALVGLDGRTFQVNRALCEMFGYTEDELFNGAVRELTDPAEIDRAVATAGRLVAGEIHSFQLEKRFRHHDGHTVETLLSVSLGGGGEGTPPYYICQLIDITERKRATGALEEERNFFSSVFDTVDAFIAVFDAAGRFVRVNRACEEIGYPMAAVQGRVVWELPERADEAVLVKDIFMRMLGGELPRNFEAPLTPPDDQPRVFSWSSSLIGDGTIPRYVVTAALDVTERKQAEAALLESEQRFESAFRHAPVGMTLVSIDGRPLQANEAFCSLVGYSEDELLARTVFDITHPDDVALGKESMRRLLDGEVTAFSYEKRYIHKRGHEVWGLLNVSLLRDNAGVPRHFVAQVLDINERHKAETAWRESEKRFAIAFQNAPIGMALIRPPFGLEVNNALLRMLGYRDQELFERGLPGVVHPEEIAASLAGLEDFIRSGRDTHQSERRFVDRNGRTVWTRVGVSAVRGPAGEANLLIAQIEDITERKQAEEALRASEERFRALVDNAFDAVFLISATGELIFASPSTARIFGYEAADVVGQNVRPYVHPDDRPGVEEFFVQSLNAPELSALGEIRLRHRDGHWVWTEGVAQNFLHNPHVRAVVVNARDITERKQAEQALQDRDARFQAIMAHSLDIVTLTDAQCTIEFMSPAATRVLGYDVNEFVGRNGFDLIHPEDYEQTRQRFDWVAQTPRGTVTNAYRYRHKNGAWRWLESNITNLLDEPSVAALVVHTRDITERKQAEMLLRESEERFALAVSAANEGLWDWNLERDEFYLSPRLRTIIGVGDEESPRAELLGLRIHPNDLERVRNDWMAHINGERPTYESEYRHRDCDGTYRWVLARGLCIRDATGKAYRIVGSLTDVTARMRAEEEARQRAAELAHVLRVSAMGEMASGLAHEINQPLAAIVNYARGTIHRLQSGQAANDLTDVLTRISGEALRASGIVRGLRQFLRKEPPHHESADLNVLVADAVRLMEADARQDGVALRVGLTADVPPVRVDHVQIEQVIVNLIRNGLEAMHRGNGSRGELFIRTAVGDGGEPVVMVCDAGEGLQGEIAEKIFDPFFTTKPNGLGMGLSISRSIIQAHGGRIWFSPNPQGGATFSFTLPVAGPDDM